MERKLMLNTRQNGEDALKTAIRLERNAIVYEKEMRLLLLKLR